MSKKAFLITVFIISLLLIGLMMLIADANNQVLSSFSSMEQKFQKVNDSLQKNVDSLKEQLETSSETIPEIVKQYNITTDELIANIQSLKVALIPNKLSDYNNKDPEIAKNNALFFTESGKRSEKGIQFLANIEAYENIVSVIHLEFPKTNTQSFKLREKIAGIDWLDNNFKDFPLIVTYTKLTAMESDIKSKQEIIFNKVLRK